MNTVLMRNLIDLFLRASLTVSTLYACGYLTGFVSFSENAQAVAFPVTGLIAASATGTYQSGKVNYQI